MKRILIFSGFLLAICFAAPAFSQCSMCAANAEAAAKDKKQTAKGINIGIFYLAAVPYALVGGLGYWWYAKQKKASRETAD